MKKKKDTKVPMRGIRALGGRGTLGRIGYGYISMLRLLHRNTPGGIPKNRNTMEQLERLRKQGSTQAVSQKEVCQLFLLL